MHTAAKCSTSRQAPSSVVLKCHCGRYCTTQSVHIMQVPPHAEAANRSTNRQAPSSIVTAASKTTRSVHTMQTPPHTETKPRRKGECLVHSQCRQYDQYDTLSEHHADATPHRHETSAYCIPNVIATSKTTHSVHMQVPQSCAACCRVPPTNKATPPECSPSHTPPAACLPASNLTP